MLVICFNCGKQFDKRIGEINRAIKRKAPVYCNLACAGIARRKHKTKERLIEEKRLYDMEYRRKNQAKLRAIKKEYFQKSYDPQKAAIERKKKMPKHIEYCRQPEYKEYKKDYDKKYRAKNDYGEYWEAYLLLQNIEKEIDSRADWNERAIEKGTLNKRQQRRREYARTFSQ